MQTPEDGASTATKAMMVKRKRTCVGGSAVLSYEALLETRHHVGVDGQRTGRSHKVCLNEKLSLQIQGECNTT